MAQPSLRPYVQIVALWVVIQAFPRAMSAQQAPAPSSTGPKTAAANSQATKSSSVGDLFFAQTKVKLLGQTVSGNTYGYHYSFAFPTNTTGDLVVTLQANESYTPTAEDLKESGAGPKVYGLTFSSVPGGDASMNSATLKYFVPYSSLPPDVVKQLQAGSKPAAGLRLLNLAYSSGGENGAQQAEPQGSNGQGEQGVAVSEAGKVGKATVTDAQAFWELAGLENPVEGAGSLVSFANDINEVLTLNADAATLLALLKEYQYCAHNPSVQNPQGVSPPAVATAGDASLADNILAVAYGHIAVQFLIKMGEVAADDPVAAAVLAPLVDKASDAAKQDLDSDLQNMRQLLPYCRGMWYGNYRITQTQGAPGDSSHSSQEYSGTLRFSLVGSPMAVLLRGTATGHFQFRVAGASGCSQWTQEADTDYTADLVGGGGAFAGEVGGPANAGAVFAGTRSMSPPTYQVKYQSNDCGTDASSTSTQGFQGWSFSFMAIDGQTTTDPYPAPAPGATPQPGGPTGQVTVTVHKLP